MADISIWYLKYCFELSFVYMYVLKERDMLLYGKACLNLTTMLVDFSFNNSLVKILIYLQIKVFGHVPIFYVVNM